MEAGRTHRWGGNPNSPFLPYTPYMLLACWLMACALSIRGSCPRQSEIISAGGIPLKISYPEQRCSSALLSIPCRQHCIDVLTNYYWGLRELVLANSCWPQLVPSCFLRLVLLFLLSESKLNILSVNSFSA